MTDEVSDPRISAFDAPRISRPSHRGRPFAKGNPGRPKGARNKLTLMREALAGQHADAVVQLALAGNRVATVALMELLVPAPAPPTVAETTAPFHSARQGAAAMQKVSAWSWKVSFRPAKGFASRVRSTAVGA